MPNHIVGLVGTGYWGPNLAKSLLATQRAELRYLCDLDRQRLEAVGSGFPGVRLVDNLATMLADPELSAVVLATPTATHFPLARQILAAGKHLLVEKPLTRSTHENRELIRLAREANRILMAGHVFSYNAGLQYLRCLIAEGGLGRIHYLSMERTNLGPVRTDVNALWDLATHDVAIMLDLLGDLPSEVTACGRSYLNPEVEDVVFATFAYANGILVNLHASWLNPRKIRQIVVVGEQKMAVWDDLDPLAPVKIYRKTVQVASPKSLSDGLREPLTLVVDQGFAIPTIPQYQPLQAECAHFLDCLESGNPPRSDGQSALRVGLVLDAASQSIQLRGVPVPIPGQDNEHDSGR